MKNNNKPMLISIAIVYKKEEDKVLWFLVRQGADSEWEIPRTAVRRGESSVRAVIRMMGEQGGMRVKVLEEAGRHAGSASVNGKIISQKYLYYLMISKGTQEVLGFTECDWFEYSKALKKLGSKKDQAMMAKAKEILKEIQKTRGDREDFEEEEVDVEIIPE